MGSNEYVYAVASGPTAEQVEEAVSEIRPLGDAWAWCFHTVHSVAYPTRLVFEGADALAFAERAVPILKKRFGPEIVDDETHLHSGRYD